MLTATLTIQDVEDAARRIHPYVSRTPVVWSHATSRYFDTPVCFKCEQFQKTGAFTARGACNAVFALTKASARPGVVTYAHGNRAAGIAYAARIRGIPANVVVPWTTAPKKLENIRLYDPEVEFCEPTMAACEAEALRIASERAFLMIRPCDDLGVIAGDATATAEFPRRDTATGPPGRSNRRRRAPCRITHRCRGGFSAHACVGPPNPRWRMMRTAVGSRAGSSPSTHPPTMADELRGQVGPFAFSVLSNLVDDIVCVSESQIRAALAFLWFEAGMAVEPSSAVALAALMKCREQIRGKRVGIVLTGGNTDPAEARALSDQAA